MMVGDYEGAKSYGIIARRLNIFALVISLILICIVFVYIINIVHVIQYMVKYREF